MAAPSITNPCLGARQADRPAVPLPVLDTSALTGGVVRASRTARWRAGVLIAVHLLIVAHILHWKFAGRTLSPVEPSESMYTLQRGELNAGFIFFAVALLATLIFGRFVCGWACHVVALQDLCAWLLKKMGLRPRAFRSRLLILVPLGAALYMFVWPSLYVALADSPRAAVPQFSNHLTTSEFWKTFPSIAVAVPFLFVCGFVTVYFLGSKGFCTYACPYGGFFGLADQFTVGKIRVTDACNGCGHCTATCTSNVQVAREVRDYGMVVDPGCMKCMDCVSVCPTDALYWGLGRPSFRAAPRAAAPRAAPRFDLTWGEECFAAVVFLAALVSLRGIYEAVPFLMALGSAAVVAFLALRLLHLVRRTEVSIQNVRLKAGGRIRPAGWGFAAGIVLVLVFTAHCGVLNAQRFLGVRDYERTAVPEDLVLDGGDWGEWVTPEMRAAIDRGTARLARYDRWGLVQIADTKLKLAWLSLLRKESASAASYLETALRLRPDTAAVRYQLASVYSLMGRFAEAVPLYERVLRDDPALTHAPQARFKLGNALAETGRLPEALRAWQDLLAVAPDFAPAHHNLAGALRRLGRPAEAVEHYRQAARLIPEDAAVHFQLGVTLSELGRFEEASPHFERAVELDPRYREFIEGPGGN